MNQSQYIVRHRGRGFGWECRSCNDPRAVGYGKRAELAIKSCEVQLKKLSTEEEE